MNFWGGSEVVDPSGEIIASAKLFDEDLIYADIHEDAVGGAALSRHFVDESIDFTIEQFSGCATAGNEAELPVENALRFC